jgi:hypothetical protein
VNAEQKPTAVTVRKARGGFIVTWRVYNPSAHPFQNALAQAQQGAGVDLPSLNWSKPASAVRLDEGFHSKEERRRATRTGICQLLSAKQRRATPPAFASLLLSIARTASPDRSAA